MRYLYKKTGMIVESGVELDSYLFRPIQEKGGTTVPDPIEDIEEEDAVKQEKEQSEKKTRTTTRKKASTLQKK